MRIITGKSRGTKLLTLPGETTRPTAERTKEAVFSVLQFDVRDSAVLDLFAGSGQLGLEAVSRGARRAVFCDRSQAAVKIIRANAEKTGAIGESLILCTDYAAAIASLAGKERFGIVFLDPPYAMHCLPDVLRRLHASGLLEENARIVCESAAPEDVFGEDTGLAELYEVVRASRYGAACVTFLALREVIG